MRSRSPSPLATAAVAAALVACAPDRPAMTVPAGSPPASARASFDDDVAFVRGFAPVRVLTSDTGGRVAVSPELQGRVLTSAVGAGGDSLGWVNRPFLAGGKRGTQFDNFGGEDRFWLGPEGGQFGLYFAPGASFTFGAWQTPKALNEGAWSVTRATDREVVLSRAMQVTNHAGTTFDVAVERTITVLSRAELEAAIGAPLSATVQAVGFETKNRITNAGREPWTKERGLPSVWILGMYAPSPDAHVVIPFEPVAPGEIVNDRYFGKVPADRLSVHAAEGFLSFTCDGKLRSKIGLRPGRARSPLASYSASARLLTLVQYDHPAGATDYVNSMWETQADPYAGDIVNSYNDGPTEPGKPSLGGFYEIESSSPAAALAPGASLVHVHRTVHLVGAPADLEGVARRAVGVGLEEFGR